MEKPYNLLFEVFVLGMSIGVRGSIMHDTKDISELCIKEINQLAKKFGYLGYEEFDKYFEENK